MESTQLIEQCDRLVTLAGRRLEFPRRTSRPRHVRGSCTTTSKASCDHVSPTWTRRCSCCSSDPPAPAQLRTNPNHGVWSANDVLAHLRACADVWGSCIAAMLAEDQPTLRAVNPRTWIKRTAYPGLEFRPSLRSFTRQRAALLAALEPLPPKAWSRAATVTGAGAPLERTVHFYAQWLATHERAHVKQVARIVNSMLR